VCAGDASGGVGGLYEVVYNNVFSLCVKAIGWRPEWRFKWKPLDDIDGEKRSAHFPMVLVQMPMYNELEVRTGHHKKSR
jgi:beta-mannan synthase